MDDFDVAIGLEFIVANQVILVPVASCFMFQGDHLGVLAAMVSLKVSSVRGSGAGAVDEDVKKYGGGECCGCPFGVTYRSMVGLIHRVHVCVLGTPSRQHLPPESMGKGVNHGHSICPMVWTFGSRDMMMA
ncbi:hypothetical protein GQ457_17G013520 [Hibiscus cannabinus]